jgi:hypothetical protein
MGFTDGFIVFQYCSKYFTASSCNKKPDISVYQTTAPKQVIAEICRMQGGNPRCWILQVASRQYLILLAMQRYGFIARSRSHPDPGMIMPKIWQPKAGARDWVSEPCESTNRLPLSHPPTPDQILPPTIEYDTGGSQHLFTTTTPLLLDNPMGFGQAWQSWIKTATVWAPLQPLQPCQS